MMFRMAWLRETLCRSHRWPLPQKTKRTYAAETREVRMDWRKTFRIGNETLFNEHVGQRMGTNWRIFFWDDFCENMKTSTEIYRVGWHVQLLWWTFTNKPKYGFECQNSFHNEFLCLLSKKNGSVVESLNTQQAKKGKVTLFKSKIKLRKHPLKGEPPETLIKNFDKTFTACLNSHLTLMTYFAT